MLHKSLSPILTGLASVALALVLLSLAGLRLTWSGSIARGLYLVVDRPIERGVLVAVCLPEDVARWAAGRGYLLPGSCPGDAAAVGKPVLGIAGDLVQVDDEGISINGKRLRNSRRTFSDSIGRPVPWFDRGEHALEAGELWLYSDHHRRSLDSRVYGPIDIEAVKEVLVPVWVESP